MTVVKDWPELVQHLTNDQANMALETYRKALLMDLGEFAGRRGYLEIVDGDDRGAYAWIAVGRLEPNVVGIPKVSPSRVAERQQAACHMIGRLKLSDEGQGWALMISVHWISCNAWSCFVTSGAVMPSSTISGA